MVLATTHKNTCRMIFKYIHIMYIMRCPKGTHKNKKTGECESKQNNTSSTISDLSMSSKNTLKKTERCRKGTHKNKKTGECESIDSMYKSSVKQSSQKIPLSLEIQSPNMTPSSSKSMKSATPSTFESMTPSSSKSMKSATPSTFESMTPSSSKSMKSATPSIFESISSYAKNTIKSFSPKKIDTFASDTSTSLPSSQQTSPSESNLDCLFLIMVQKQFHCTKCKGGKCSGDCTCEKCNIKCNENGLCEKKYNVFEDDEHIRTTLKKHILTQYPILKRNKQKHINFKGKKEMPHAFTITADDENDIQELTNIFNEKVNGEKEEIKKGKTVYTIEIVKCN